MRKVDKCYYVPRKKQVQKRLFYRKKNRYMDTSATLLTTGSIIIGIAALLAVLLVLLTMRYRKRQMVAHEDEQKLPTRE